jgi:hypothetical protein
LIRTRVEQSLFVPGLGHPVHKDGDPRTPVLSRIAAEAGVLGNSLRLLEAIDRIHRKFLGRRLPVNGAGVCGAALADIGIPPHLTRGVSLVARSAGLLGHIESEVAAAFGPFVVLLGQDGADEADDRAAVGEDPDDVGAAADLAVEAFVGVVGPDLSPDLLRERSVKARMSARAVSRCSATAGSLSCRALDGRGRTGRAPLARRAGRRSSAGAP